MIKIEFLLYIYIFVNEVENVRQKLIYQNISEIRCKPMAKF